MKYLPPNKAVSDHYGYQQRVKETNIKRIFDLVRSGKCKSRAEIVRYLELSATSVSVLVDELATRGLIEEVGPTRTSMPGRRPISLRLVSDARQMVVFTFSAQAVRYNLLDLSFNLLETRTLALSVAGMTDEKAGEAYTRAFDTLLRRRAKLYDPQRALMIGICYPGISLKNSRRLYTRIALGASIPLEALEAFQRQVNLPIYMLNVTRSMAYAEKHFLESAAPEDPDTGNMVYVALYDKSIGSAIISNGELFAGPYNLSGQVGHISIDFQGKPCYCGNRGCLERYLNLDTLLEDARKAALDAGAEPPESLEALAQRMNDEPALMEVARNAARLLAHALYSLLCSVGMRRIVLGGPISQLGDAFLSELDSALRERAALTDQLRLSYAQASLDAQAVGLARHYLDKVYTITM